MFKEMFCNQIINKLMLEHDIYVLSGRNADFHFSQDEFGTIDWHIDDTKMYIDGTFVNGRVYGFISDMGIKIVGFNAIEKGVVIDRMNF